MNETKTKAILLAKHHDITPFVSTDESRYALNGVHYHKEKKVLEATDGRIIIRVPVEQDGDDALFPPVPTPLTDPEDCIIPTGPFKKALVNIPNGSSLPILKHARLDTTKDGDKITAIMTTTDVDTNQAVSSKTIEGRFPHCDHVFPTEAPKFSITLAPEILVRLAAYANKFAKEKSGIRFDFLSETEAVRFSFTLENGQVASGVLMPMRMD